MKNVNVVNGVQVLSTNPDNLGQVSIEPGSFEMVADDKFTTINDGIVDISGEYRINGTPIGGGGIPDVSENKTDADKLTATNMNAQFNIETLHTDEVAQDLIVDRWGLKLNCTTGEDGNDSKTNISAMQFMYSTEDDRESKFSMTADKRGLELLDENATTDNHLIFKNGRLELAEINSSGNVENETYIDTAGVVSNGTGAPSGIVPLSLNWLNNHDCEFRLMTDIVGSPVERIAKIILQVYEHDEFSTVANVTDIQGEWEVEQESKQAYSNLDNCSVIFYMFIPSNTNYSVGDRVSGMMFSADLSQNLIDKFPSKIYAELYRRC